MSLTDIRLTDYQAGYRQAKIDAAAKLAAAEAEVEKWRDDSAGFQRTVKDLTKRLAAAEANSVASLKAWRKAEAENKSLKAELAKRTQPAERP